MDASVYQRPRKPKQMLVTRRDRIDEQGGSRPAEPVEVWKGTECHVTPSEVAQRMVGYLEAGQDCLTLEPSAGTGNLMQALLDSGHSALELIAVEQSQELCKTIRARFKGEIDPICRCFLNYAEEANAWGEYPRIIMNPPFRAVKKHMDAALSLLGQGGHDLAVLVALVPITYQHPEAITHEVLPNDTFSTAAVNTKIIGIYR